MRAPNLLLGSGASSCSSSSSLQHVDKRSTTTPAAAAATSSAAAASSTYSGGVFEIPCHIPEEDVLLLQNLLTALQTLGSSSSSTSMPVTTTTQPLAPSSTSSLSSSSSSSPSLCVRYKIDTSPTGYLLKALLPSSDVFEVTLDDLLFLQSVCPARVESIALGRSSHAGGVELFLRVLDHRQRVMVTSNVAFFSAARMRKFRRVGS